VFWTGLGGTGFEGGGGLLCGGMGVFCEEKLVFSSSSSVGSVIALLTASSKDFWGF